jgi:nucleotide-binding universal stress UspA family protein
MTQNLLIPLDGSAFGEHALAVGLDLVRRTGGVVHLAHVHSPPLPPTYFGELVVYDSQWEERIRADERDYLRAVAGRLRDVAGVSIVSALLEGEVVPALSAYADRHDISLIVMTTHGRGGISRAWLGSTADGLLRHTHRPLILLRPGEDGAARAVDASFRHILVPLDGSDLAEDIIEPALALGRIAGARFTLMRACTQPHLVGRPFGATQAGHLDAAELDRQRAQAQEYLDGLATQIRAGGVEVDTTVTAGEQAAPAILQVADSAGVGLVAMATHGRGGWSRLAVGSVADKVVRGSSVPVLLLRPERARSLPEDRSSQPVEYPLTV